MSTAPAPSGPPAPAAAPKARDPLHALTLAALLKRLVAHYGWPELARQVPIRCFALDPSVASSLAFLRRTPWARAQVESLYLYMLREQARARRTPARS